MRRRIRSPAQAAEQDRRTALRIACGGAGEPGTDESVRAWLESGTVPDDPQEPLVQAMAFAAELASERGRSVAEAVVALGQAEGHKKGDHVTVVDPHSRHYGRSGVVWFVRNGRVMVTMEAPGSISGCESNSFLPEHLEVLRVEAKQSLERPMLRKLLQENAEMHENLSSTQERCTVLLEATRALRQRIVELGGEDPGPA